MLLRDALRVDGRALAASAACAVWSCATLSAFLLARHDWLIVAVPAAGAAVLYALRFARQQRAMFGIVACGLTGGLLALEIGLRLSLFGADALVHPSHYGAYSALLETGVVSPVDDPRLGFGLTPGYEGHVMGKPFRTSAQGFRTKAFQPQPEPGTVRVLVFGASIAMGAGVSEDETYTAVLGRRLTANLGHPVEALDLGVPAYSVPKTFYLAERMAQSLRPRVVVIELPPGALFARRDEAEPEVGRRAPLPVSTIERYSFAASALYPPANLRERLARLPARFTSSGRARGADAVSTSSTPPLEHYLERLTNLGRVHGFAVVVLLVRPMAGFAEPNLEAPARQRLQTICREQGATLVDTFPLFHPGELADDFIIFPGDLHPDAAAHARFASALADAVTPILHAPQP